MTNTVIWLRVMDRLTQKKRRKKKEDNFIFCFHEIFLHETNKKQQRKLLENDFDKLKQ